MGRHSVLEDAATSIIGRRETPPPAESVASVVTHSGAKNPFTGRTASRAIRWSLLAVVGRQGLQMIGALVLARILGPSTYGVISAATIYVTLSALILDQGMAAALVQRKDLPRNAPGAVATFNIFVAVVVGALTWFLAPQLAKLFDAGGLVTVLRILGAGLVFKAVAITPRAMLSRSFGFKSMALADISGALFGTIAGITAGLLGAGYDSMIYQVLVTDLLIAGIMLAASAGPVPNLKLSGLGNILAFGMRVFATNTIAYFSRNTDNILVGRFLGVASLSFYSMAYRVLVIPVQMVGQTVNRVMFPVFARMVSRRDLLAECLVKSTEMVAICAVPPMVLLACSSHGLIPLVLGTAWAPTAPLVTVLALAGARETIFYITPALMKATGNAGMNLRFEIWSTAVQVAGIVVGLHFGLLGVAIGYALGGLVSTPALMRIQRRLTGVTIGQQLSAMAPALHASSWGAGCYIFVSLLPLSGWQKLVIASAVYALTVLLILRTFHRDAVQKIWKRMSTLVRGPGAWTL